MSESSKPDPQASSTSVLLVTAHDWFASALQAVLEPEGFAFARVRSARLAVRDSALVNPEIVIIGENLPDMRVPELARALLAAGLRDSVPILVYSPNFWAESDEAAAMAAGAWDIIKEPVRSQLIVAKLRRLLEIKRLIEQTEEGSLADTATGLYNLAGLMRVVRLLEANASCSSMPLLAKLPFTQPCTTLCRSKLYHLPVPLVATVLSGAARRSVVVSPQPGSPQGPPICA